MPGGARARRAPAIPIAGDSASDVALGEEVVVVRVGAGQREHEAVVGHARRARRFVRAEQQRRGLVDVDVGAHQLRVRERDHAVLGGHGPDLLGGVRRAGPRVRVLAPRPRRTRSTARATRLLVLVDAAARRGARARSRTAGTPASARARGAPSRTGSSPGGRRPRRSGTADRRASVQSSHAFGSARRARHRV